MRSRGSLGCWSCQGSAEAAGAGGRKEGRELSRASGAGVESARPQSRALPPLSRSPGRSGARPGARAARSAPGTRGWAGHRAPGTDRARAARSRSAAPEGAGASRSRPAALSAGAAQPVRSKAAQPSPEELRWALGAAIPFAGLSPAPAHRDKWHWVPQAQQEEQPRST